MSGFWFLQKLADNVPQYNQQNDQRDVSSKSGRSDGDCNNTHLLQYQNQAGQNAGGENCLGDLFANYIGEEEGVQRSNQGVSRAFQRYHHQD